ncbi:MAG: CPBP family intramembrane metalloprotease [Ignavibacteriaceae bacterium]|nr:CPBP family intramembrane metalloprotease [Ignavibacteriaceae bacterium]
MEDFENKSGDESEQKDIEQITEETNTDKEVFARLNPIGAGFLGLFGGFFLYQFVGGGLSLLIFGMDLDNAPVNAVRLMTMGGQILFMLLPALLLSKLVYEDVGVVIKIKKPDLIALGLFLVGMIILTPLLQSYLAIQNYFIEQWAANYKLINDIKVFFDSMNALVEKAYSGLLKANNVFEGLLIIIVVAVVPALSEETLFRGFIQNSFQIKMRPFYAALITAIFFGLFHFSPYGMLPLISLGMFFGFAAYKSDSLIIPMILHFFNNFVAVIIYFMVGNADIISTKMETVVELKDSFILFTVLLSLFAALIFVINYYYSQNRPRRIYAGMP